MTTDQSTDAQELFTELLELLPVAFAACGLDWTRYPTTVREGKEIDGVGEYELRVQNQLGRTLRIVSTTQSQPIRYALLCDTGLGSGIVQSFALYRDRPYNTDAETLCCRLVHSLSPRPVEGGRSYSKKVVREKVLAAIAQYRQSQQPDRQAAVLGNQVQPTRTDTVLGGNAAQVNKL